MMIDFQKVRFTRSAVDLAILFACSAPAFKGCESLDSRLEPYYRIFVERMSAYGYGEETYPLGDLKRDFRECFIFGMVFGTFQVQVRSNDHISLLLNT